MTARPCAHAPCGAAFTGSERRRYCSIRCQQAARNAARTPPEARAPRPCAHAPCGRSFVGVHGAQRFCSPACSQADLSARRIAANAPRTQLVRQLSEEGEATLARITALLESAPMLTTDLAARLGMPVQSVARVCKAAASRHALTRKGLTWTLPAAPPTPERRGVTVQRIPERGIVVITRHASPRFTRALNIHAPPAEVAAWVARLERP